MDIKQQNSFLIIFLIYISDDIKGFDMPHFSVKIQWLVLILSFKKPGKIILFSFYLKFFFKFQKN